MGACVPEMGVYFADTGIEVHLFEEVLADSLISIFLERNETRVGCCCALLSRALLRAFNFPFRN